MRVREMHEVFESFKGLESGKVDGMEIEGCDGAKKLVWAEMFRDKVDTTAVTLTGHSFGGGTLVSCSLPSRDTSATRC